MAPKIQHKRSAVAGKAPLPSDLEYGEIAVNYEATEPVLYVKDSANAIRKVGWQPDASTTAKGIVVLADAAAITAGTVGRVVDAAQLKAAAFQEAPNGTVDGTIQYVRQVVTVGTAQTKTWAPIAAVADATETVKGIAEVATQAEANAGTDDSRMITPLKLATYVSQSLWIDGGSAVSNFGSAPAVISGGGAA